MDYNTFAEMLLRFAIQSSLCFAVAWMLDHYGAQSPRIRLWTWNLAALFALAATCLPYLPTTILQCPLSGHSALYLNYTFRNPASEDSHEIWCAAMILTWIWAAGTLTRLALWSGKLFQIRRQLALRQRCQDAQLLEELRRSSSALGLSHPIRLSIHPTFSSPVVVSRGELCLSRSVLGLHARELRAVIGHELAHIERRDHIKIPMMELARCFVWFAPFWGLFHSARSIQVEELCDLRGSQNSGSAHAMASALVNIAAFQQTPGGLLASLGTHRTQLVRRVRALMQPTGQNRRHNSTQALFFALGLGLIAGFQSYAPLITMSDPDPSRCTKAKAID